MRVGDTGPSCHPDRSLRRWLGTATTTPRRRSAAAPGCCSWRPSRVP